MADTHEDFRKKVDQIFTELAGPERARWLRADVPSRCVVQVMQAMTAESGCSNQEGLDIGINVCDWQGDAAFLVALHLFPERFTPEEIDEGVRMLLIHVPDHVVEAARVAGHWENEQ